ncbi:MAG TPA: penicillin-binding protein 1C [bacterium]
MQKTIIIIFLTAVCVAVGFFVLPVSSNNTYPRFSSFRVLDRNGVLLREVLSRDYKTSVWVPLDSISPHVIRATVIREDKRFMIHHGIDLIALTRALATDVVKGKTVSGGSTITMQVAKMTLGMKNRGVWSKLLEMAYALKLELYLSKAQILEIYLNRSPYGNQAYGIEAAAVCYFEKKALQLSLGESALLAVIPQSPTVHNPFVNPDHVMNERNHLLETMLGYGVIDTLMFSVACSESPDIDDRRARFYAPHFVDYILAQLDPAVTNGRTEIMTTLDLNLQKDLEKLLATSINTLRNYNVTQGAAIVIKRGSGDILAMVGSKDYFDCRDGQVNGCTARRQPGSSIKPFLYALGLKCGIPVSTVLPDSAIEFRLPDGTRFAPQNYGERYHGPTRAREALGSSFNVPTVVLLERIGIERFHQYLRQTMHFTSLDREASHYGLALALGAAEATLLELTNGYRAFANGGVWKGERCFIAPAGGGQDTLPAMTATTVDIAYIITDILADNASRLKAFGDDSPLDLPFECAVKTGTSKNYRDNWCIGYTSGYVVGVWVGNFDGSPMHGVSGISGTAPLFRDIMIELHRDQLPAAFDEPPSLEHLSVCARSGLLPSSRCDRVIDEIFIPGTQPKDTCAESDNDRSRDIEMTTGPGNGKKGFHIVTPSAGDIFTIDPRVTYNSQAVIFKVQPDTVAISEVTFVLNGAELATSKPPFEFVWKPKPGEYMLEARGHTPDKTLIDRVSFRVF